MYTNGRHEIKKSTNNKICKHFCNLADKKIFFAYSLHTFPGTKFNYSNVSDIFKVRRNKETRVILQTFIEVLKSLVQNGSLWFISWKN